MVYASLIPRPLPAFQRWLGRGVPLSCTECEKLWMTFCTNFCHRGYDCVCGRGEGGGMEVPLCLSHIVWALTADEHSLRKGWDLTRKEGSGQVKAAVTLSSNMVRDLHNWVASNNDCVSLGMGSKQMVPTVSTRRHVSQQTMRTGEILVKCRIDKYLSSGNHRRATW